MSYGVPDSNQPGIGTHITDLSASLKAARLMYVEKFFGLAPPWLRTASSLSALPTAAQAQVAFANISGAQGCNLMEIFQTTAQTLLPTGHDTKGLLISGDLVDNEAWELVPGGNSGSNPLGSTVGTDPFLMIDATFEIADVSGLDQFGVILRKQEAYAVPVSYLTTGDGVYTDFVGLGFSGTGNPNTIKIFHDLNNSGSTTVFSTGFTVADAGLVKLSIRLRGGGATKTAARYFINGVEVGGRIAKDGVGTAQTAQNTLSYSTFVPDTGDFYIPTIYGRHDTTTPGAIYLRRLVTGWGVEAGVDDGKRAMRQVG